MDPWYTLYMRAPVLHSSQRNRIFHDTASPSPPCRPLLPSLSLIPHLIHFSSTCPPFVALFHPAPSPFHPTPALWSPTISSFHKSNFTSLLPPHPSITFPAPPLCHGVRASQDHVTTNVGTCWASLCSTTIRWFVSFVSYWFSLAHVKKQKKNEVPDVT